MVLVVTSEIHAFSTGDHVFGVTYLGLPEMLTQSDEVVINGFSCCFRSLFTNIEIISVFTARNMDIVRIFCKFKLDDPSQLQGIGKVMCEITLGCACIDCLPFMYLPPTNASQLFSLKKYAVQTCPINSATVYPPSKFERLAPVPEDFEMNFEEGGKRKL